MKLKAEQLTHHLKKNLAPLYFLSGNEPLLQQEACDAIRACARSHGYDERDILDVTPHFNWQQLLLQAHSPSLFSKKKIIELRMPTPKPGKNGSEVLQQFINMAVPDTLLLITTTKLESNQLNSKWVKAIDASGVICQFWPITPEQLPQWLNGRMQQYQLRAEPKALHALAGMVEGNLLAAAQEIEKLRLIYDANTVLTINDIINAVSNHAHFSVFTLSDAVLSGDAKRTLHVFANLRREKAEPILILWALQQELQILIKLKISEHHGENLETTLSKERNMWPKRKMLFKKAVKQHELNKLQKMLCDCAHIDKMIKGIEDGNVWDALQALSMNIAASYPLPPCGGGLGWGVTSVARSATP